MKKINNLLIPNVWMSDVSESLRSLTKTEQPLAICTGCSPKKKEWANRSYFWANRSFFWANRSFAHFFAKNKEFAQKTYEQIPSPYWQKSV